MCVFIQGRALRLKQQKQYSGELGKTPGPSALGGARGNNPVQHRVYASILFCFVLQ